MQVCTFEDNRHQILRCAICDAVRGTSLDYFMGHNAEVSSGAQHDAPDSMAKSGSRSRRAGSEGLGNKQKTILGFFAGSDAAFKSADTNKAVAGLLTSIRPIKAPTAEGPPNSRLEPEQTGQHASTGMLLPYL